MTTWEKKYTVTVPYFSCKSPRPLGLLSCCYGDQEGRSRDEVGRLIKPYNQRTVWDKILIFIFNIFKLCFNVHNVCVCALVWD